MPATQTYKFLPREALLTFEEITKVAELFVGFGVRKLRVTGGEPLLRKDLDVLLKKLVHVAGDADIALTTNGFFLKDQAQRLRDAGLKRVTVSLDSLQPELFATMSGRQASVETVLQGIRAAQDAGLGVKVNMVVQRGLNDADIVPMAEFFRDRKVTLRFIEFMDVGNVNQWERKTVFGKQEILDRLSSHLAFYALEPNHPGETASRYQYSDNSGEFGIIASVTEPFCGDCSRIRLSASGTLYTCLFAQKGHDLKALLRGEEGLERTKTLIKEIWGKRTDRYSENRAAASVRQPEKVEMFHIGG
jgi:cyclic pyranopterin phosphate synthase